MNNRSAYNNYIDNLGRIGGTTNHLAALANVLKIINDCNAYQANKGAFIPVVIFLTDGAENVDQEANSRSTRFNTAINSFISISVPVYTLAIDTLNPSGNSLKWNTSEIKNVAEKTGGSYFPFDDYEAVRQLNVSIFVQNILDGICQIGQDSSWTAWSSAGFACSYPCGNGQIRQKRECRRDGLVSGNLQRDCGQSGRQEEFQFAPCSLGACQGVLTGWEVNACPVTCNTGGLEATGPSTTQVRLCMGSTLSTNRCNGAPLTETILCSSQIRTTGCLGTYGTWSEYGACQLSCSTSSTAFPQQFRTRTCSGDTLNAGCAGSAQETKNCAGITACPVGLVEVNRTACSATCQSGNFPPTYTLTMQCRGGPCGQYSEGDFQISVIDCNVEINCPVFKTVCNVASDCTGLNTHCVDNLCVCMPNYRTNLYVKSYSTNNPSLQDHHCVKFECDNSPCGAYAQCQDHSKSNMGHFCYCANGEIVDDEVLCEGPGVATHECDFNDGEDEVDCLSQESDPLASFHYNKQVGYLEAQAGQQYQEYMSAPIYHIITINLDSDMYCTFDYRRTSTETGRLSVWDGSGDEKVDKGNYKEINLKTNHDNIAFEKFGVLIKQNPAAAADRINLVRFRIQGATGTDGMNQIDNLKCYATVHPPCSNPLFDPYCSASARCTYDGNSPSTDYRMCLCPIGFTGDGVKTNGGCTVGLVEVNRTACSETCQSGSFAPKYTLTMQCIGGPCGQYNEGDFQISNVDCNAEINCPDEDECILGTHTCDDNAACTNIPGGFTCKCNQGYSGDGMTCTGINNDAVKGRFSLVNILEEFLDELTEVKVDKDVNIKHKDELNGRAKRIQYFEEMMEEKDFNRKNNN